MILTISDTIMLLAIIKLYGDQKPASRSYVQKTFHDQPIKQSRFPNYSEIEKFCKKLNLVIKESDEIFLTDLGKKILAYSKEKMPEEFQEFFIKNIVFESKIGEQIHNAFSKFYMGIHNNIWYPKHKVHDIFKVPEILPILYEINLLEKNDDIVEINPKYIQFVIQSKRKITQKQLDFQLQSQKTIGAMAEKIVFVFERNRLAKAGHVDESAKIDQISNKFANAGYDIESFAEGKNGKIHKIYIEVKGSSGKELNFHWSANELEKAKEYGEKYWIYFVPEIDIKTGKSSKELITIQNPFESIFKNSSFVVEIEKYHVIQKQI